MMDTCSMTTYGVEALSTSKANGFLTMRFRQMVATSDAPFSPLDHANVMWALGGTSFPSMHSATGVAYVNFATDSCWERHTEDGGKVKIPKAVIIGVSSAATFSLGVWAFMKFVPKLLSGARYAASVTPS